MDDDRTRIAPTPIQAGIGTQLSGVYELDEKLGSGGMGEVWRGHNIQTGDSVAIKIVLPEFARDQTILQLFRKEALILNRLSHDAIVRYHLFTVDATIGRPYLAMEFVEGESLFDVMRRGPLPVAEARRLCLRLAGALAAVHEAHVFHRDLSPDNIILPDGRVERAKIIDFGIARSARLGEATLIGGRFAGKYNYVSPEQLGLFGGEISERSDIYSLGLVLAAALRGAPIDMSGSQWEVIEKRRVVPDLSGIDAGFRPLLSAMLQPDPADRPRSMNEVVDAARADDGHGAGETRPPVAPRSVPADAEGHRPPDEPPGFVPHRSPVLPPRSAAAAPAITRRRSGAGLAAAAVLLLALGGGSAAWFAGLLPMGPGIVSQDGVPQSEPSSTDRLEPSADRRPPADVQTQEQEPPPAESARQQPESPASDAGKDAPAPLPTISDAEKPDASAQESRPPVQSEETAPSRTEPPAGDPSAPPENVRKVAERIAWLRDFSGGDCFYATAVSATDKEIEIEGFGTGVEPFAEMLESFQARFGVEPEVGVRLIDASQCPVTGFLRALGHSGQDAPELTLAQSSVADGGTLRGTLQVAEGGAFHLFLIDHKGIAFSLDKRVETRPGGVAFDIPIALSAADQAAARPVPQVILAVASSGGDLKSAVIDRPMPAEEVLAAISAEVQARKISTTATAKYFRLGG